MKRTILLLSFSLIAWKMQAQNNNDHLKVKIEESVDDRDEEKDEDVEEMVTTERKSVPAVIDLPTSLKHNAKINLTSLALRNISLQYEYNVVKKLNVAMGIRFMPKGGIPFLNSLQPLIEGEEPDEDVSSMLEGTRVSGFAITPEVRWYFGKKAGKGFYLAPFFRYEQTNVTTHFNFETETEGVYEKIDLKGNFHNTGVGLLLGAQFNLSKRINLDWWILGPYYNATRLNIKGTNFNLSDEDLEAFESTFEDIVQNDFVPVEGVFTNTSATLSAKAGMPFIRGFGICIGFRF